MKPEAFAIIVTTYVLAFVAGCATPSDGGTLGWRHDRNHIHATGPIFPSDTERSRWVTRSGAGRE